METGTINSSFNGDDAWQTYLPFLHTPQPGSVKIQIIPNSQPITVASTCNNNS